MLEKLLVLLFPPKCVICQKLLQDQETDLCHHCRLSLTGPGNVKKKISFVAGWAAVWYYKDDVRSSLLRFKFGNRRSYASAYGRLLAMQLLNCYPDGFDLLTWVPVSPLRRMKRGYDQGKLLADAVGAQLGMEPVQLLRKPRNNPPQSGIKNAAMRQANVKGVYRCTQPALVKGKRILLVDDIITTGATASECARTLRDAGAKQVYCGAVAAASDND